MSADVTDATRQHIRAISQLTSDLLEHLFDRQTVILADGTYEVGCSEEDDGVFYLTRSDGQEFELDIDVTLTPAGTRDA